MARRKRQRITLPTAQKLPTEVLMLVFENGWTAYEAMQIDYYHDPAPIALVTCQHGRPH